MDSELKSSSLYFYEYSKASCGDSEKRDLYALINFKYEGPFAALLS